MTPERSRYGRGHHYRDQFHHEADAQYWSEVVGAFRDSDDLRSAFHAANEACRSRKGRRIVRRRARVNRWADRIHRAVDALTRKVNP